MPLKNPEARRQYQHDAYLRDKTKREAYRLAHKERDLAKNKIYKNLHKEEAREKRKTWDLANKEKTIAQKRAWRIANKEKIFQQHKEYVETHRDKIREIDRRRLAVKINSRRIEKIDYEAIKKQSNMICYLCNHLITTSKFDYDHIIPLSMGGDHVTENIRITHVHCNRAKLNKAAKIDVDTIKTLALL